MYILTLNAGSSSLKFAIFDRESLTPVLRGMVAPKNGSLCLVAGPHRAILPAETLLADTLVFVLDWLEERGFTPRLTEGVGHRIVHGGTAFAKPITVTPAVLRDLSQLRSLAPLHSPFGLDIIQNAMILRPHLPHVACFDTAFHLTQPEIATRLPLPAEIRELGYRRYGFHGLNYEHVVGALPKQTGRPLPQRLLAAHLGAGSSMTAIVDGKSVATTMGYSTADGLVMGTRTGSLDPGVMLALMRDKNMQYSELENLIYRRSGLLGISGFSSDMQVLLASDDKHAKEAVEQYCYAAARQAGSLIVAMGGIDAVVFSGGIGENSPVIRAMIMEHLDWLNVAPSQILVVPADEEAVMARHVAGILNSDQ